MLAGIREILLISTPCDLPGFQRLLGDGSQWGLEIQYAEQPSPRGLAEAFLIGRKFIGDDNVTMILGDNLFYGQGFQTVLEAASEQTNGATIFGYHVQDPERYGVVEFDREKNVVSLEEKPLSPKVVIRGTWLVFLRQSRGGHRLASRTVRSWRIRNYRRQQGVPEIGQTAGGVVVARICLV